MGSGGNFYWLFLALSLSACASRPVPVVEDVSLWQTISVNTPGVSGARCFLQSGSMSYPMEAPGKVSVRKTYSPIHVTCFKGEHMVGNQKVMPTCSGCGYPNSVVVAMSLNGNAFDVKVRHLQ